MLKMKSIMEYLVENRVIALPADALSDVFDKLIWCVADNGEEICSVRQEWLQSGDEFRVEIALSMVETFPYRTRDEMAENFARIASRWPRLRSKCDEWLLRWDKQFVG